MEMKKDIAYACHSGTQEYGEDDDEGAQHTLVLASGSATSQEGKNDQETKNHYDDQQETKVNGSRIFMVQVGQVSVNVEPQYFFGLDQDIDGTSKDCANCQLENQD